MTRRLVLSVAVILLSVLMTSCIDGNSKYSYSFYATFEYLQPGDELAFGESSHYGKHDILYDVIRFSGVREGEDSTLTGGFAFCRVKDSVVVDRETPLDPFTVYENDPDSYESPNHFVVYMRNPDPAKNPARPLGFIYSGLGGCACTPVLACVANTTESYAALSALEGDVRADVTFTGYMGDVRTGEVTVSLLKDGKPLAAWETVDLSSLGSVEYVTLDIVSTADTVRAVALDNLVFNVVLEN